jgi:hypothetical protein
VNKLKACTAKGAVVVVVVVDDDTKGVTCVTCVTCVVSAAKSTLSSIAGLSSTVKEEEEEEADPPMTAVIRLTKVPNQGSHDPPSLSSSTISGREGGGEGEVAS